MSEKVELTFRYVPRKYAAHQLRGLVSAANRASLGKKYNSGDIPGLFGALVDSGRVDLLRSEHHDLEVEVSVIITLAEFRTIMSDGLNHHGTLVATNGTPTDLVVRPELLVTHFARYSNEEWAIGLRSNGIPTCVWINGHGSNRRAQKVPHRKRGVSVS